MDEKNIYKLDLFEEIILISFKIKRVPGGWMHYDWDDLVQMYFPGVFIPYHNEFEK